VEGLASLLPFVLIAAVFWFLLIRPQRKRQQELASTQRSIGVGDEVMLGAGIIGRVAGVGDEYLGLELSPGVEVRVVRGAVVKIISQQELGTHDDTITDRPDDLLDGRPDDSPYDPPRDH
jgi:preprotein translocase subunit YajC